MQGKGLSGDFRHHYIFRKKLYINIASPIKSKNLIATIVILNNNINKNIKIMP